jgi:hypothetical protein
VRFGMLSKKRVSAKAGLAARISRIPGLDTDAKFIARVPSFALLIIARTKEFLDPASWSATDLHASPPRLCSGRAAPRHDQPAAYSVEGIPVVAQDLGADEGVGISTNQCAALDRCDRRRRSAWREPCNHFDRPRSDRDPAVVGIADFGTGPGGRHHGVARCQFRGPRDLVEAGTAIDLHRPLDGNQRSRARRCIK